MIEGSSEMKRGTKLIILGFLIFLTGISLMRLSMFSREEPVWFKKTLVEHRTNIPSSIGFLLEIPTICGINLTGPFINYTQDQPVVEIRDFDGRLVYSNSSFPPPSIIEFEIADPGLYFIDFNIVFGEGSIVEVYYYDYKMGFIRPYEGLFYPGVFLGVLGIAVIAAGMLMPSKKSEEDQ